MRRKATAIAMVYGMEGFGATAKEARANARARLVAATKGSYEPITERFPTGIIGTVFRTLYGWEYQIVWADDVFRDRPQDYNGYASRLEAERGLRLRVAQNLLFVTPDHGASVVHPDDRDRHLRYVTWQLAVREALDRGYDVEDARRLADGQEPVTRPQFPLAHA